MFSFKKFLILRARNVTYKLKAVLSFSSDEVQSNEAWLKPIAAGQADHWSQGCHSFCPAICRKVKETCSTSNKSIAFMRFLSLSFAFTVCFVDQVNHFHVKINLNMHFHLKVIVRFWGEAKFYRRMRNHTLNFCCYQWSNHSIAF